MAALNPTPWSASDLAGGGYRVSASDGTTIAEVFDEKDARKIAAAPDLLEALDTYAEWLLLLRGDDMIAAAAKLKEAKQLHLNANRKARGVP